MGRGFTRVDITCDITQRQVVGTILTYVSNQHNSNVLQDGEIEW